MGTNKVCGIWGTPASWDDSSKPNRDGNYIDSPRAGGKYFISRRAKGSINKEKYDDRFKARLTSWLVRQRLSGAEWPEIATPSSKTFDVAVTLEEAEHLRDLAVDKRADLLLHYIEKNTPRVGSYFNPNEHQEALLAWSESVREEEGPYLLDYLTSRNWLEFVMPQMAGQAYRECRITVEGYARLAELGKALSASSQAFVAMWFDKSMDAAWEQGVKPGIEDARYEPVRIDQKEHANKIDDEIISEIRRSRFVVADFTQGPDGARGGVYYEAGFAHGLNIPVIFTCRQDAVEQLHFDTRQYAHIVWEKPEDLRRELANRISALIGDGPGKEDQPR